MTAPVRPHPVLEDHFGTIDDRPAYVKSLFDATAYHYDCANTILSLGSGQWYRRRALKRGGLRPGMRLLDVAVGTGLVTKAALSVTGGRLDVVGVDISWRMLAEAKAALRTPLIQANAERLPIADASIDFVSMGYALRHVCDLVYTFREFRRVLRPGGTLLLLEFSRPAGWVKHTLAAWYLGRMIPALCRQLWPRTRTAQLMHYFWETIDHCVPSETIIDQLWSSGFLQVSCETDLDLLRAYRAKRGD
jgi:demethylmenaquinone methyltransferase/2-methoxy-6-polyprenyl-1,4-benzoquinol methylase